MEFSKLTHSDSEKVSILTAALTERYESIRVIRGRVQEIGLWVLGLMFASGAWIVTSDVVLSHGQKAVFLGALAGAFGVIRFSYLRDLETGFKAQQRVAARIESALNLFSVDAYDDTGQSIYPAKWRQAGTAKGGGKFFGTTNLLLYLGTAFVAVAILGKHWLF